MGFTTVAESFDRIIKELAEKVCCCQVLNTETNKGFESSLLSLLLLRSAEGEDDDLSGLNQYVLEEEEEIYVLQQH